MNAPTVIDLGESWAPPVTPRVTPVVGAGRRESRLVGAVLALLLVSLLGQPSQSAVPTLVPLAVVHSRYEMVAGGSAVYVLQIKAEVDPTDAAGPLDAYDPRDGHRLWQAPVALRRGSVLPLGDLVLLAEYDRHRAVVSALDAGTGAVRWRHHGEFVGASATAPAVVSVREPSGRLAFLASANGAAEHRIDLPPSAFVAAYPAAYRAPTTGIVVLRGRSLRRLDPRTGVVEAETTLTRPYDKRSLIGDGRLRLLDSASRMVSMVNVDPLRPRTPYRLRDIDGWEHCADPECAGGGDGAGYPVQGPTRDEPIASWTGSLGVVDGQRFDEVVGYAAVSRNFSTLVQVDQAAGVRVRAWPDWYARPPVLPGGLLVWRRTAQRTWLGWLDPRSGVLRPWTSVPGRFDECWPTGTGAVCGGQGLPALLISLPAWH